MLQEIQKIISTTPPTARRLRMTAMEHASAIQESLLDLLCGIPRVTLPLHRSEMIKYDARYPVVGKKHATPGSACERCRTFYDPGRATRAEGENEALRGSRYP
jgi:hypothetical protein